MLLSVSRRWPDLFKAPHSGGKYSEIPLHDRNETRISSDPPPERESHSVGLGLGLSRLLLVSSICALAARVELFRRIYKASECTAKSVEIVIPLVIAIYDAVRFQKPVEKEEAGSASIFDKGRASLKYFLIGSRWRYVPSACALTAGCYMTLDLWSGLNSTYICPLVVGETRTIPLMQWGSASLDCFLAIAAYELSLPHTSGGGTTRARGPAIWSAVTIVSVDTRMAYKV